MYSREVVHKGMLGYASLVPILWLFVLAVILNPRDNYPWPSIGPDAPMFPLCIFLTGVPLSRHYLRFLNGSSQDVPSTVKVIVEGREILSQKFPKTLQLTLASGVIPLCLLWKLSTNDCWHWQLRLNQLIFISLQSLLAVSAQSVCRDGIWSVEHLL